MQQRRILHFDMDAFFASVEILDHPELAGLPVLVGGAGPRSVVAACSYEARKFGVHSAMPMRMAIDLCPQAILMRPRRERYSEISEQVFDRFRELTPLVEPASVDEGYVDISDLVSSDGAALDLASGIKDRIRQSIRLTCSIGIAPCKFVSKIASDLRKPDGLVLIPEGEVGDFLAPLPVERIPGVGKVGSRKLHALGAETIAQLREIPREALESTFGKWGNRLFDLARGIDPRPVEPVRERKSIGTEETFDVDTVDTGLMVQVLARQSSEVAQRLRGERMTARTVTVKVRYSDFRQATRQQSFGRQIDSAEEIESAARILLDQTQAGARPIRLVGVSVSGLLERESVDSDTLF